MKLTLAEAKEKMAENQGNLSLNCSGYTELPAGLIVDNWLELRCTRITKLPDGLLVGGGIDLSKSLITELPDNLVVGGGLDLSDTQITKLPDNLTVGTWINLSGTKITELPDTLTLGGPPNFIIGGPIRGFHGDTSHVKYLKNGEYAPGRYLYADYVLTHVGRKKRFQNYDYYVGKIPGHNVICDGTYYAHCSCIRNGTRDLSFKHAENRGADQYRNISLDKQIPTDELVTMYRVITGACLQGTELFLRSLGNLKDSYTIQEAAELTAGQYGNEEFKCFFGM